MNRLLAAVAVAALLAGFQPSAGAAAATDSQIKAEIGRQLARLDPGAARLSVDVKDGVVSLSGDIATLWLKEEAIRRVESGRQSLQADA